MDNKEEDKELVEGKSGVVDQIETVPVEGAGVEENKVRDPQQAEPPLGDQDELGGICGALPTKSLILCRIGYGPSHNTVASFFCPGPLNRLSTSTNCCS